MPALHVRAMRTVVIAVIALAGCRQSVPARGPAPAAQNLDQIRFGPPAIPGVDGPLAQTQPDMPAEPWTLGPPIVVTTAELMARGSGVARDRANAPSLNKPRPDRTQLLDNPEARPLAQWPPSPFFRGGGPSAAFVAGTPNVNVASLADTGGALPPDTMGDAGPTQYVVALNGRVRAITKATGAIDPAFNLDSDVFYGAAAAGQPTGDPRVRYDRRVGRWYILMFNIAVPNRILLAVSDTSTITGSTVWSIFFWNNTRTLGGVGGAAGCLADYPTLGVDEDALYIGVNQFCGASINSQLSFDSVSVYVLPKANLLAGVPVVAAFDGVLPNGASAGPFTAHGVDNFDTATNEGYFIGVDNATFSTLMLRRVSNPATTTPSLSGNVAITVPTTTSPINVPQPPGAVLPLDGLDDRLINAVIRNGRLWTVHTNQVNASGVSSGIGGRNGQRWYEITSLSGTPSLVQSGTVFDPAMSNPTHHWMGSIMVNGQGHAALGASRGGAATFVNTEFTGRLAGATAGTMETPTQYSPNASAVYNIQTMNATRQRWGDYSYTSVDPNDDMTMWTLQEYPTASNNYAVRLIRLQAPPPAAIASLSPSSVATGQTSVNVTVTGTSSAGSGFFDPGAAFPNRIAAAFSGTGVTVSSISFNSPTSLTLTLNTVGAAAGARTLTVTNPDAQQSSLASALTITASSAPTANNDSYSTPFNTTLNVAAPGVLGNDTENGGGAMTALLDSGPASGTLTLNANGSFTYAPASGFTGPATFTYHATNSNGPSNIATVTVTVNPPPAPTAVNDSYSTPFNTTLNVAAPGVLGNDNANGGGAMTATLNAGPASGTLALNANGSFTFTPASGFTGNATFTYRANTTAGGQSAPATVTITVNAPPAPTAANDSYNTPFNTALNIGAPGVLGNDNANGGGTMTATVNTSPVSGTLTLNANGSFTFTPPTGFTGPVTFTYRASTTAGGASNVATVTLTVDAPGAPTAVNDAFSTAFNTPLTVAAPGVLGNDNANGGGAMTATLNTGPTSGTLTLNANGSFAYTPASGFTGTATFTYRAGTTSGGQGAPATVTITVNAPAAPATINDAYATPFNTPLSVGVPGVLGNDNANGGGTMTATLNTGPASGTLTLNANGSFTYTPVNGFSGAVLFTYRASTTAGGQSAPATVTISVSPAAPPTSTNDTYSTPFQTVLNVAAPGVLGNDNSNGGGAMTAVLGSTTSNGTLALGANGGFTYTPNAGFSGSDSFSYRASNASGPGNVASVSIAVGTAPTSPQPPSNFRILDMTGNTITFAWNLPTVGATPTALQLEGGLMPGTILGQLPLGVTPSATIALPTGSFYLRLRTIAGGIVSDPSNEILAHINVPLPPSAPSSLLGLVDGSALHLAWTPSFGGGEPTGAVLDVTGAVTASLPLGATETFSFSGVPAGSYTFAVRQTNGGGASAPSAPVTLTFPGVCTGTPQAPTDIVVFKSGGVLSMFWSPPTAGPAATGYVVNVTGSFVGSLPMASRTLSVAPPAGTYTLSIVGTNPCGAGASSAGQTLTFP